MILLGDEKNTLEKKVESEDINYSKQAMGGVQKNNKKKVPACLLYLLPNGTYRIKLAHRTPLAEGISWSVHEIRFEGTPSTMLQLQYKLGRKRGNILLTNAKRDRPGKNAGTGNGKTGNRTGL